MVDAGALANALLTRRADDSQLQIAREIGALGSNLKSTSARVLGKSELRCGMIESFQRAATQMAKSWSKPIEQIALTLLETQTRVVGFTSPTADVAVGTVCASMAGTLAAFGSRTLLVDLSKPVVASTLTPPWLPGEGGIGQSIRQAREGFDVLEAAPTPETRLLFSNAELIRRMLSDELRPYGSILVEMPPVLDGEGNTINPVGPALACDSVIMMCSTGRTTKDQIQQAVDPLRSAGVKLGGVIMDDRNRPTLAEEMAQEVRRISAISPAFAEWLVRRIMSSSLLNGR